MSWKNNKDRWGERGSMTVEASLLLPLMISFVCVFFFFFQMILLHQSIHTGLWETAKKMERYGYVYDHIPTENEADSESSGSQRTQAQNLVGQWLSGQYIKTQVEHYVSPKFLAHSCVKGKASGISYSTSIFEEEKEIWLQAEYVIAIPLFSNVLPELSVIQKVKTRGFVGTDQIGLSQDDEDERTVYVTQYGQVYHTSLECSHLRRIVSCVSYGNLAQQRNQYGGRYHRCRRCVRNGELSEDSCVYITPEGTSFHTSLECGGLNRYIQVKKLSELSGYSACSRCGGSEE